MCQHPKPVRIVFWVRLMPHQQCPLCLKATTIIPQTHWFLQNTIQAGTARWVVHPSRESVCTFEVKTFKSLLMSELKRGRKGIYPIKVRTFKSLLMSELKKRENGRSTRSSSRWLILLPWILRSTFKDASTACLIYRKHKAQWWFNTTIICRHHFLGF
jgi:hypothetical protein